MRELWLLIIKMGLLDYFTENWKSLMGKKFKSFQKYRAWTLSKLKKLIGLYCRPYEVTFWLAVDSLFRCSDWLRLLANEHPGRTLQKIAQTQLKNKTRLKNKTIIQPEEEVVSPLIIVVVSLLILGLFLALFILILPSRIYNCMMRGTIFEDQPQKGYKHIQNV